MDAAQLQADIINVIVIITFFTSLLFPAVTALYWPWWRHPYARATVSIDILLALVLLPAIIRRFFGIQVTNVGFGWFEIVVFAFIPVRTAFLAWTIYKLQRQELPVD